METHVRYLARSPIFETERAFSTDFPVDHVDRARRTNHEVDDRPVTVAPIEDPSQWKLDVHGFCILHAETHLDPQDVYTKKKEVQGGYWYEIEAILHKHFPQYSRVESFDLTVYDLVQNLSWQVVSTSRWLIDPRSVWRPLVGSTDDWPLALCDYTTINTEEDIRLNDAIRRDLVGEGSLLHYNEAHRWYYLKDQGVNDLIVFRNSDSQGKRARCFHAAVFNPDAKGPPRQSVEVRVAAFY
ncbi:hypothetical protein AUP68_06238 [Ilyonectria robusta]